MLDKDEFINLLGRLQKEGRIKYFHLNYEKLLSPIYYYPIKDNATVAIETDCKHCYLVMRLFLDDKKRIRKMKIMYHYQKFSYRPDIFKSVDSGFIIENFILNHNIGICGYANKRDISLTIKNLTNLDNIYYYLNHYSWDKIKKSTAEEHFDLVYRMKNPTL